MTFPFWAYAIGTVAFADYRAGNFAAILLATFTVVSGLISPRMKRPCRRHDRQIVPKDGPRLVDTNPPPQFSIS